ncbi:MAG: nucleotidyl transferase AbiEii/AbiGii toxin family protein [Oscillospiraceae bacterium]|nr:nucleotidyl transferase AbiEii/AbiGii toxin family protein [Oscillospiraceae bacterium]
MITRQAIIEWQEYAPWLNMHQVEQDLIISRALLAIYSDGYLASRLAFRGGTALHRIYFSHPMRYSEDIDLFQAVLCFKKYIAFSEMSIPTGKEYLINLEKKINNRLFISDTDGILRPGIEYVPTHAFDIVKSTFIDRI